MATPGITRCRSRIEKRFSKGYTIQGAYTWSKAMEALEFMNPADTQPYESLGGLDRPHRLSLSGIYELPFGRGRRFLASAPGAVDFIAGGWQLNGIISFQSGAPLWALGTRSSMATLRILRCSQVSAQWIAGSMWMPASTGWPRSSLPPTSGPSRLRFSGVRGDAQHRWDLSAIKNFRITEEQPPAVPRGGLQRAQSADLQQPKHGSNQHRFRASDGNRRQVADIPVRAEAGVLGDVAN
ncbi:MAG: hypothetical protein U5J83_01130 [Bryobacterales bacterium]|nr:hypothetical protein [Bryobacterales bacterium]